MMTFVTYREPQASSQADLLIRLLESGGLWALRWGNPILHSFLPAPWIGPHGARKASWTWYLTARLPAKCPKDTHPDTWILLLFLGHGDPGAPSLRRKHPKCVRALRQQLQLPVQFILYDTEEPWQRPLLSHSSCLPTGKALICQGLSYKPGVNLPSPQQVLHDCSVSRPLANTVLLVSPNSTEMRTSDL